MAESNSKASCSNSPLQSSSLDRRESCSSSRIYSTRSKNVEADLLRNLNQFRQNGEFCDVKLKIEDRSFLCHRNILAATSAYFRILVGCNQFKEGGQQVIELHDIKASTFEKLLNFVYGSSLVVGDDLIDLLFASSYLQIQAAEDILDTIIRNETEVEDLLKVIAWPGLKLKADLYRAIRETICTQFERVSCLDEFLKLPFSMLKEILSSADLLVTDRDHLIGTVIRWICYDLAARYDDIVPALRLISTHFKPNDCFADLLRSIPASRHKQDCLETIFLGALASKTDARCDTVQMPFAYVPTYLYAQADEVSLLRMRSSKKLPASVRSFEYAEAALLNENLYLTLPLSFAGDEAAGLAAGGYTFYRCRTDTSDWEVLPPTRGLCRDLVAFNGTLYSYQTPAARRHQFFSFARHVNRWFALPAAKVVREQAGVTCDARVLYAVGGQYGGGATGALAAPAECAIEMYDSRCKSWMNIVPTNKPVTLFNVNLSKRVVFFEGSLYVLQENAFEVLEMRSRRWLNDHLTASYPCKPRFAFPGKTHLLLIDANQKFYYYSTSARMWRRRNANNVLDDMFPLKPVFIPRY